MKRIVLSFCFLFISLIVFAQDHIVDSLYEDGFENLQLKTTDRDYYLSYENNRYRFEVDALHKVLELIASSEITQENIHILIKNRNIPYSSVHGSKASLVSLFKGLISIEEWISMTNFTLSVDELRKEFNGVKTINSSFYKVDIPVGASLRYQLGNFDNPIRVKYQLQPELYSTFANGAYITALYNIPVLKNDFDNYNNSRFYSTHITKDFRFPSAFFLNVNAGYFFFNRYGIWAQASKFFKEETFRVSLEYRHTKSGVIDPDFSYYTYGNYRDIILGGITYRNTKFNTDVELKYGQFYRGDLGYNLDFTRQINEVYISLFLKKSDLGNLVGFRFRTPLGFKKHLKPSRVRIRTREYFKLKYNYNTTTPAALNYDLGEKIFEDLTEYYPSTFKYGLKRRFND